MTPSEGPRLLRRFSGVELFAHWAYAALFTVLAVTGICLYENLLISHRALLRSLHLDAAILFVALPVMLAAGQPQTMSRLRRDVEWFDRDDGRWLLRVLVPGRLRRRPLPAQGRLNAGQKLNSVVVAAATIGFIVTGSLMWQGAHLPNSLSEAADSWHILLTAAMLPLLAGHLFMALVNPATRPAMRGILTGFVRRDFARRRHARWVAEMEGADQQ